MRIRRYLVALGATVGLGILATGGAALATFTGASNGNVAFVAICDGVNIGQAVYSVNPNGNPPPTYTCPGGTAPNYTQSTAGATDSMPYFSSDGATLYFSSDRGAATNPPFAIYKVTYPAVIGGSPGSQTDGAVALTSPAGSNDYAPTVSADGATLSFIRCDSSNTTCHLETQSPVLGGSPIHATTPVNLRPPDAVSGAANRPEIDPVNSSRVLYVGTDNHIHLFNLGTSADRDLSSESGVGSALDEYPDWSPDGTKVAFDSSRASGGPAGHSIWRITVDPAPAVAASLWGSNDPGTEIEPIYAPQGSALVWTKLGNGSNIVEYSPNASVKNSFVVSNLTNNKTNNSQPAWQPVPTGTALPEAPYAALLPGVAIAGGGLILGFRRRRRGLLAA